MIVDRWGQPMNSAAPPALASGHVARLDAWQNPLTGVGTGQDKTVWGRFSTVRRVTDVELTNLYNGSPLAAKIVEKKPKEMFRRGYELECADVDASALKDLQDYAEEELHISDEFLDAVIFGNQYGGDALVMGIDDGNMPDTPLDEDKIKTFEWFNGIDRRFSYVLGYYTDAGPKFSKPSHYLTSNAVASYQYGSGKTAVTKKRSPSALEGGGFFTAIIHESRILRFEGVRTDIVTRQTLAGWTWSILQRVYDSMRKFEHSMDSTRYLLSDASQAVLTLKGFIDAISAGKLGAIQTRMDVMEMTRSVMHGIAIDEGEKFERQATPFGGISDVLRVMMQILASDTGYTVTELFGQAASGLNAAAGADSETRKWYDDIGSDQKTKLAPAYARGYRLIALSDDCPVKLPRVTKTGKPLAFTINFKPLFAPTDDEEASTQLKRAQRDQIYLSEGVVTETEVALDVADMYPSMDVEGREAALEGGETFNPHPNDPPPPVPVAAVGPDGKPIVAGPAGKGPPGAPAGPQAVPKGGKVPAPAALPAPVAKPAAKKTAAAAKTKGPPKQGK
jgi:uncharacterized protein